MKHSNDVISPKDRARLECSITSLEADRIAEEKRNIELTKKYNLLEFV